MFKELEMSIRQHTGEILCSQINSKHNTKVVIFTHLVTDPVELDGIPEVGDLREFYSTFGSVLFYYDSRSGDAGKHLAPIVSWSELHECFIEWVEDLDEEEREDMLPNWVETALVIGETPRSGNYILVPTQGDEAGHVFEFDHDGFEFSHEANSLVEYAERLLKPDSSTLTDIASHMRFIEGDPMVQWWIQELKDNRNHVVQTNV